MDSNSEAPLLTVPNNTENAHFNGIDVEDIPPIKGIKDFFVQFKVESGKLWYLAAPAIFTTVSQYLLGAITQILLGQVGPLELAAFSIENSVIAGFSLGILLGMGSALETLCGQAFGAGQVNMLGVYMQRSWVILLVTSLFMMFFYIFATPILLLIGQTDDISQAAGKLAIWMIPQLFAYAFNFPIVKFLQSQSKIMVMAYISAVALVLHTLFSWFFILKLGWGLVGAAVVLNLSWWFMVISQMIYILSGTCGEAWSGFSLGAFSNLWSFVKLSLASAVMLCLEIWYYMALILFAGYLKNAEISVDALSICTNILGVAITIALGFNAAVSVRVSNELGAAHPTTAKFSVVVVVITSFLVGCLLSSLLIIFQHQYPAIFSNSLEVQQTVYDLTPLLAICLITNEVQPALSGVAIGAGWQAVIAYVNITCYYIIGIPLGLVLGFAADWGVKGIWIGMLFGTVAQTVILVYICYKTNWDKEAAMAEKRIRKWSGQKEVEGEQ